MAKTNDRAALDQWYCVDDVDDITASPRHTRLLGQEIVLRRGEGGAILCNEVHADGAIGAVCRSRSASDMPGRLSARRPATCSPSPRPTNPTGAG